MSSETTPLFTNNKIVQNLNTISGTIDKAKSCVKWTGRKITVATTCSLFCVGSITGAFFISGSVITVDLPKIVVYPAAGLISLAVCIGACGYCYKSHKIKIKDEESAQWQEKIEQQKKSNEVVAANVALWEEQTREIKEIVAGSSNSDNTNAIIDEAKEAMSIAKNLIDSDNE